jgi:hypothetical protein
MVDGEENILEATWASSSGIMQKVGILWINDLSTLDVNKAQMNDIAHLMSTRLKSMTWLKSMT